MHIIQKEIGAPKMSVQKEGTMVAVFTIAPLPSGFGHTLGNAVRRVLLSSLPGAAITAVKVSGVSHEYSTVPGVKDSVLDIILNLKKVRFKKHSSETEVVTLEKKGEGPVTAKDIKTSSDIEILNPDQVITVLDKKNSHLSMELRIEKGVGYLPTKLHKAEGDDADWIYTDAVFSPVLHVQYEVLPTRVGDKTNLDKLELEVKTNGALSPEDSVKFAAEVLQNYFVIFTTESTVAVEPDFITNFAQTAHVQGEDQPSQEAYTPIEILNLSPRTLNALINGDIGSIEELTKCSLGKLSTLRGFGKKAQDEVMSALESRGLALATE